MAKRVLIISSSPRKGGNSEILCEQFAKGAMHSGHDVQIIRLNNMNIGFCKGCEYCIESGECVQQDDMKDLLQKVEYADVLVFATPVYFYSMSAQLKVFIDRTLPIYENISCKDIYFILTSADECEQMLYRAAEAIRGYTEDCLDCCSEKGVIYATGVWERGAVVQTDAYKEAYNMGLDV